MLFVSKENLLLQNLIIFSNLPPYEVLDSNNAARKTYEWVFTKRENGPNEDPKLDKWC